MKWTRNGLISHLIDNPDEILKTHTRKGVVYSFRSMPLKVIDRAIVEGLIQSGSLQSVGGGLLDRSDSQLYELSQRWRRTHGQA